jgi:hypothetical protein
VTTTAAGVEVTSKGISALIWPTDTNNRAAARPATVTVTPPRVVGRGTDGAETVCGASFFPKIETQQPGATLAL